MRGRVPVDPAACAVSIAHSISKRIPSRRALAALPSVLLAFASIACGSAGELPPAAEPAASPPLTATPAGRVVDLDDTPEGIAADPRTGLVAIGLRDPDRLALVNGRSAEVVRRVRLPESPRHLQLASPGGPVLVPAERANALAKVDLPGGHVQTIAVGRFPHDAAAAAGRIFVADEFADSVSVVMDGRVTSTLRAPVQPGGVAALDDRLVGVVAVRSNVLALYDARTLEPLATIGAGAGPTHVVAQAPNRFYVTDTRGDAVLAVGTDGEPRVFDRINVPGAPYGIAIDQRRGRLWVTATARNELLEFDPAVDREEPVRTYPTVRQPNTVAVDPASGRVFVAGAADGELQIIDEPVGGP